MTAPLSDARLTAIRERHALKVSMGLIRADDNEGMLLAEIERLQAKVEERRVELRDRRTEDLTLRGLLAPDGMPRRVPMELGISLVPAVEWLLAEASAACPPDCPCRQIPLTARWDNEVIHPNSADREDTETVVCCVADGGQPVAVMLDDDQREALGLALLLPDGDGDIDPQHLELARENEQLRAQVTEMRGWITEAATICRDHNTSPVKRLAELTELFNG